MSGMYPATMSMLQAGDQFYICAEQRDGDPYYAAAVVQQGGVTFVKQDQDDALTTYLPSQTIQIVAAWS